MATDATEVIEQLSRWEQSGGRWRVLAARGEDRVIGLFTCDGGEEMGRVSGRGPALDAFLAGRTRDDDR